jgi:hypothetical protein
MNDWSWDRRAAEIFEAVFGRGIMNSGRVA